MTEFAYNKSKNASIGHTFFEINYGYHPGMLYEEDVNSRFYFKSADELSEELKELMIVYCKNLHYTQELQKQAHDKRVKPRSYALSKKVWLNSKYIKIKYKQKLEAKFFGLFQVLHPVGKQVYKLELARKWKIHDVFYVSQLEQNTRWKGREFLVPEFEPEDNDKEYKVETIRDSVIYDKKVDQHLPELYYLVAWKVYLEKKNTWEDSSAVIHLWKMVSAFYKNHSKKRTMASAFLDSAPPMAKLINQLPAK